VRLVRSQDDLRDRFEVIVDQDAEPADLDEVFLVFVDRVVERRLAARNHSTPAGTPAAERSISNTGGSEAQHASV